MLGYRKVYQLSPYKQFCENLIFLSRDQPLLTGNNSNNGVAVSKEGVINFLSDVISDFDKRNISDLRHHLVF